jgi:hypothetical protein
MVGNILTICLLGPILLIFIWAHSIDFHSIDFTYIQAEHCQRCKPQYGDALLSTKRTDAYYRGGCSIIANVSMNELLRNINLYVLFHFDIIFKLLISQAYVWFHSCIYTQIHTLYINAHLCTYRARGMLVKELSKILNQIFGNETNIQVSLPAIHFCITKAPSRANITTYQKRLTEGFKVGTPS